MAPRIDEVQEQCGGGLAEDAINILSVMLSYWVDYGMSYVDSDAQFRFTLALCILFALLDLLGICLFPKSPVGSSPTTATTNLVRSYGRSVKAPIH